MGNNGHEADICQGFLEIEANSQSVALDLAKQQFCAAEQVRDWKARADRIEIAEAEYTS